MKPDQQRIAIAEACGFADIMLPMGFHQQLSDEKSKQCGGRWRFEIPDYLNDLNAMHEAEKVLWDTGKAMEFTNQLVGIVCSARGFRWDKGTPDDHLMCLSHATAAQRAEAFLRTLNLWIE